MHLPQRCEVLDPRLRGDDKRGGDDQGGGMTGECRVPPAYFFVMTMQLRPLAFRNSQAAIPSLRVSKGAATIL
jgi:hypothetical protein